MLLLPAVIVVGALLSWMGIWYIRHVIIGFDKKLSDRGPFVWLHLFYLLAFLFFLGIVLVAFFPLLKFVKEYAFLVPPLEWSVIQVVFTVVSMVIIAIALGVSFAAWGSWVLCLSFTCAAVSVLFMIGVWTLLMRIFTVRIPKKEY